MPADTRGMEALVGLLGEEISRECSTIEKKTLHEARVDQSLFSLDESIFKERRNMVGRVKERILPKRSQPKKQPTDFIKTEPTEEAIADSKINSVSSLETETEENIPMESEPSDEESDISIINIDNKQYYQDLDDNVYEIKDDKQIGNKINKL